MPTPPKQQNKEKCKNCLQNITCSFCEEEGCRKCMKNHFNSNAICIKKQTSTPEPTIEKEHDYEAEEQQFLKDVFNGTIFGKGEDNCCPKLAKVEPTMSEEWQEEWNERQLDLEFCYREGYEEQGIKVIKTFIASLLLKAEERGYNQATINHKGTDESNLKYACEIARQEENARCIGIAEGMKEEIVIEPMSEKEERISFVRLQDFINNAKITE